MSDEIEIREDKIENKLNDCSFRKEVELTDYIIKNIIEFMDYVFEDKTKIKQIVREFSAVKRFKNRKGVPNIRADIYVETEKGEYIIEIKNPKNVYSELRNACAQIMDYDEYFKGYRKCLVTSKYNNVVTRFVDKYDLDFEVVIVRKNQIAKKVRIEK